MTTRAYQGYGNCENDTSKTKVDNNTNENDKRRKQEMTRKQT